MNDSLFIDGISLKAPLPESSYLKRLPAVAALERDALLLKKSATFLVGENGCGKSTLIEAIAVCFGFNPEGGSLNFCFETKATHSELHGYLRLSKHMRPKDGFFLRAESFYNAASYLEELDEIETSAPPVLGAYGGTSLHEMSHGEGFMALIKNRFFGRGLYILDEPEAALSPTRVLALIYEIDRLRRLGSQFIIATHSPMLLALPDSDVISIGDWEMRRTDYRETEHFKVMKSFLDEPERYLRRLLRD